MLSLVKIIKMILSFLFVGPQSQTESLTPSKQELNAKDSKDKSKKDDIPNKKEETPAPAKKTKLSEKLDSKGGVKDKSGTPNVSCKQDNLPEYLLFASFNGSSIRNHNRAFADLKRDSGCLLYTSPSPRDKRQSRMPSSA